MAESWLILETSGRAAKIGLVRGGVQVCSAKLDEPRRQARDLAATVERLLKAESLTPTDLTGVMVGLGPGSYTGLRVGLISAKAFAFATGCKLIAVETFAAVAAQAPADAQAVWVIADALQGQVYCNLFSRESKGSLTSGGLRIESFTEWAKRVGDTPNAEQVWISGQGVSAYAEHIPASWRLVPEADREPRIESVFGVGTKLASLRREEMFALEPLYLRGSSAEEKAKESRR
jgi:tRNA threonylcarbamoyladenosine biosynthesis protein TsaB